jgi:methylamine dehydrogenase light chain
MTNNNDKQTTSSNNRLDDAVTRLVSNTVQQRSRRQFLAKLGKIVLAIAGGAVANALPADRRVVEANTFPRSNCYKWNWCGMNGRPCASCGGSDTACPYPGCSTAGSPWHACCNNAGVCKYITYYDCCNIEGLGCNAVSCTSSCQRKDLAGWWCNGGNLSNYRCTLAVIGGSCSPCPSAPQP